MRFQRAFTAHWKRSTLKVLPFIVPLFQIFTIKYGSVSDPTSSTIISRNVYLPFPVVTDRFVLTVNNGSTPIVFMMDVIGADPATKYSTDPMLTPAIYKDCEFWNSIILLIVEKLQLLWLS